MSAILVLGNAAIDLALRLDRLPVTGETVLATGRHQDVGGKGLNQAVMAGRAGATVRLLAALGDDGDALLIRQALARENIPLADLQTVPAPTDRSVVLLGSQGDNMIVTAGMAASSLGPEVAASACARQEPGDLLLVQGNLCPKTTLTALQAAKDRGMRIVANPAPWWFDWTPLLPLLDVAVVNEVEAREMAARPSAEPPSFSLIVTRGPQGAELCEAGRKWQVDAPPAKAVDTTGAGDVLVGVLTAGLAQGMTLERALRWGVAAASAKVQRLGTLSVFPDAAELATLRP